MYILQRAKTQFIGVNLRVQLKEVYSVILSVHSDKKGSVVKQNASMTRPEIGRLEQIPTPLIRLDAE